MPEEMALDFVQPQDCKETPAQWQARIQAAVSRRVTEACARVVEAGRSFLEPKQVLKMPLERCAEGWKAGPQVGGISTRHLVEAGASPCEGDAPNCVELKFQYRLLCRLQHRGGTAWLRFHRVVHYAYHKILRI